MSIHGCSSPKNNFFTLIQC